MIVALMIGRKGSTGFPNKNTIKIFNKHLCEYPQLSQKTKIISNIFISTDCPKIKKITKKYNPIFLKRLKHLATNAALGEEVFKDAYLKIKKMLKGKEIKLVVLLMANAGTINSKLIKEGIKILLKNKNMIQNITQFTTCESYKS